RNEGLRHSEHAEEVDLKVLFDDTQIAQVVVDGDAGVVDEDVEGVDRFDRPLDLRRIGYVEREGRDAVIGESGWTAASGKHLLRSSSKGLGEEGAADAAVCPSDQDCLVRNVDPVVVTPGHG